jgi:hypothetical protein
MQTPDIAQVPACDTAQDAVTVAANIAVLDGNEDVSRQNWVINKGE